MVLRISPNKVSGPNNVIKKHENSNNAAPFYAHTYTHKMLHSSHQIKKIWLQLLPKNVFYKFNLVKKGCFADLFAHNYFIYV